MGWVCRSACCPCSPEAHSKQTPRVHRLALSKPVLPLGVLVELLTGTNSLLVWICCDVFQNSNFLPEVVHRLNFVKGLI